MLFLSYNYKQKDLKVSLRPTKKTDHDLYKQIEQRIKTGDYVFTTHAKQRQQKRVISDLTVLNILETNYRRKRNKIKDSYTEGHKDWNYCIEGSDDDENKIRIIISFDDNLMLIITVIRL